MHFYSYLVCLSCSGHHRLPGHRRNDPDADQDPPASYDGYGGQYLDLHASTYQYSNQHPCAYANGEPHGHPATDGHARARADGHARARKYASPGSHTDPCGTSHRHTCTSAVCGL